MVKHHENIYKAFVNFDIQNCKYVCTCHGRRITVGVGIMRTLFLGDHGKRALEILLI